MNCAQANATGDCDKLTAHGNRNITMNITWESYVMTFIFKAVSLCVYTINNYIVYIL